MRPTVVPLKLVKSPPITGPDAPLGGAMARTVELKPVPGLKLTSKVPVGVSLARRTRGVPSTFRKSPPM